MYDHFLKNCKIETDGGSVDAIPTIENGKYKNGQNKNEGV
ncbi:hypothetical protein DI53_0282 [Sphingobacterium deserti]|uniref:Uncharacterized protein n=1 Tax=Sphingobacterium deserti TaxID=1229276 RepID=A0A0B8T3M9_9SPHI|nr:hypothetical protein DI53_0282 [Sphingobacterium deserti]